MNPAVEKLAARFLAEIEADLAGEKVAWPSIPAVAVRIREVVEREGAKTEEITRAVATDPAMAARLLMVANSVYYGGFTPCRDLRTAVVRVGGDAVKHVALLLATARIFNVGKRKFVQPHLARLWHHSTLVASLAEALATHAPGVERDEAMLAGLIHDIGAVPVILHAQKFPSVLGNPKLLDPIVRHLHVRLGTRVLDTWRFSSELVQVVAQHHKLDRKQPGAADLVDVVLAADLVSHIDDWESERVKRIWRVPALRRLGVDPPAMQAMQAQALEASTGLRELLGGSRAAA